MGDYGKRHEGNDQAPRLWMENGNQGNALNTGQTEDWGQDLWEKNPAHRNNLPSPTDSNSTSDVSVHSWE